MRAFDYVRAGSVAEAVAAAGGDPDTAYLAGGTNLLDLMKADVRRPSRLVDITRVNGLDSIELKEDGSARIGALVRNSDLARHAEFAARYPAIAEALLSGASGQLRNAATMGGNILQRTRCSYFYDPHSRCNQRHAGSGCDARDGLNDKHAILGWSEACIATHPSDLCVPLAALDAVVEVEGRDGKREVELAYLHQLPNTEQPGATALAPGELVVAVRLPAQAARFAGNARYLKLRDRTSYAFAIVSSAAMLALRDGIVTDARIALGSVAPRPWRAREAEASLKGRAPEKAAFENAARLALKGAKPSGDNAYKIELARRLLTRALVAAAKGTPERMPALPGSVYSTGTEA